MSVRRLYETTYILNSALEDADIDAIVKRNGFYVYLAFDAPSEALPLLEKFFFLEEGVMRHLILQLDPKLREFRKVRAEAQAIRAAAMAEAAKTGMPIL